MAAPTSTEGKIPTPVGVLGAGTMGAGIAQLAAGAGAETLLYDPVPGALERGLETVRDSLRRLQERGRITAERAEATLARLTPVADMEALAPCQLVIEAVPERLELKLKLFVEVAAVVSPDCVLATNTSSLGIGELAAGVPGPERLVGLHFFNPAPVMRLAEVIPGLETAPPAVDRARALAEAMGKRVVDAADIAGFLVNRVNRPFFLEALRIVEARQATVEQVDRIMRMAGGFRMGPFELMDLIGIDTNHAVAEEFYRRTYGEPRYRPSQLAAAMVVAGRLGRKTGRGWYEYGPDAPPRPTDPPAPEPGGGFGRVLRVVGHSPALDGLRHAAQQNGWDVDADREAWLTVAPAVPSAAGGARGAGRGARDAPAAPRALLLAGASLHACDVTAAGLHLLAPLDDVRLIELTRTPLTDPVAAERLEDLVRSLGAQPEWVGDGTGLVLGRIVAQLVNEAAFMIGDGNASPADVDAGLELGVNHPRGPVAWSAATGLPHMLAILDGLQDELHEERYRAAPLLCRRATLRTTLAD